MTRAKFGNVRTTVDGIVFDSKAEARRYQELRLLEKAGEICAGSLRCQASFPLSVTTSRGTVVRIGAYVADFDYVDRHDRVIEDVKGGDSTPLYKWKKKHFEAEYGLKIVEIRYRKGGR